MDNQSRRRLMNCVQVSPHPPASYLVSSVAMAGEYAHSALRMVSQGIQTLEALFEHSCRLVTAVWLLELWVDVLEIPLEALAAQLPAKVHATLDAGKVDRTAFEYVQLSKKHSSRGRLGDSDFSKM